LKGGERKKETFGGFQGVRVSGAAKELASGNQRGRRSGGSENEKKKPCLKMGNGRTVTNGVRRGEKKTRRSIVGGGREDHMCRSQKEG